MFPVRHNQRVSNMPVITYSLIGLNVLLYLWDRQFQVFGNAVIFGDLTMRPNAIADALHGGNKFAPVTMFTSLFLHGNITHLIGNMLFLLTFGEAVENAMGQWRFTLYYLFWGIFAAATHVFVNPGSSTPTLGASGAIGGVLGAYFLLYPASKIEIFLFVTTLVVDAWILLGLWFLWQILVPVEGVANWAHAGGFMAGMATVLVMGGRNAVLKGRNLEEIDDFD